MTQINFKSKINTPFDLKLFEMQKFDFRFLGNFECNQIGYSTWDANSALTEEPIKQQLRQQTLEALPWA